MPSIDLSGGQFAPGTLGYKLMQRQKELEEQQRQQASPSMDLSGASFPEGTLGYDLQQTQYENNPEMFDAPPVPQTESNGLQTGGYAPVPNPGPDTPAPGMTYNPGQGGQGPAPSAGPSYGAGGQRAPLQMGGRQPQAMSIRPAAQQNMTNLNNMARRRGLLDDDIEGIMGLL